MVTLSYGKAGTGKTTSLIRSIGKHIENKEKVILLVPEQFSFESERRIYEEFGPKSSLYAEVVTFTRLSNNIFREYGGIAGTPVTDTARYVIMSVVVRELTDQLQVYRKSSQNSGFLETLLQACSEFKVAGIPPTELELFAEDIEEGSLREKIKDLSLIYSSYQALLDKGYSDPEDDLMKACYILENNNYFKDFHIYVDGFTTFMAGEFEFLSYIVGYGASVDFAFTTEKLIDTTGGTGVFSPVQKAVSRIRKQGEEYGVTIEEVEFSGRFPRYNTPELKCLSQEFLQGRDALYSEEAASISLFHGGNIFEEIQMVACEIQRLVREEDYRYKEIGIICRSVTDYISPLELLFHKYNIPFFADKRLDLEDTLLIMGLTSALHGITKGYGSQWVLAFAKSPIMGLNAEKVALLENYVYLWQIDFSAWREEFQNHPRGMVDDTSPRDEIALKELNKTRSTIMSPLLHLEQTIKSETGNAFARGIFSFLEEIKATKNLVAFGEQLPREERENFFSINTQIWDNLMDILDVFGQVLEEIPFDTRKMLELLELALTTDEIGVIPQTSDQVLVGGADRIRPGQLKAVFVLGANEGVFPANVAHFGVFSQNEREKLVHAGFRIPSSGMEQALLERFFAYFACTLPSDNLTISWSSSNLKGEEGLPSAIVNEIEEIFPNHRTIQLGELDFVQGVESAKSALAGTMEKDSPLRATLWEYFSKNDKELLLRMERATWKPVHKITDKQLSVRLFGSSMRLSPSKVERFYRCPFSYFISDGLKLRPRQRVEFSPLESGSVIHHVLEQMMRKYGGKALYGQTHKELELEVSQVIKEYLSSRVEDAENLPVRFTYLFQRLCTTLAKLLHHIGKEFSQSAFEPIEYELKIAQSEDIKPITLTTKSGIDVTVEGIIDRVDVMDKDGERYIRVVDYKSGAKSFRLQDVLHGLNLQMLLYLFTLEETGIGKLENGKPAGVLYMPIRESYMSVERNTPAEKLEKDLEKQWTMSGLLLDDEESLKGMEEDLDGLFIPAQVSKSGKLTARSSVADAEEMGLLAQRVKEEVLEMGELLSSGTIPAYPVNDLQYPTCSYCSYKQVCGYEEGDPNREIQRLSHKQVLELLFEEEENE